MSNPAQTEALPPPDSIVPLFPAGKCQHNPALPVSEIPAPKPAPKPRGAGKLIVRDASHIKIRHLGRWFKMWRDSETADAPWKVYVEHARARYKRSTGLCERAAAIAKAEELISAIVGGNAEKVASLKLRHETTRTDTRTDGPRDASGFCTVGDVLRAYAQADDLNVGPKAQEANPMTLRNCIRRALKLPLPTKQSTQAERLALANEIDAMSTAIFTDGLAQDYYAAMRATRNKAVGPEAKQTVQISFTSLLKQGCSVFNQLCLLKYKRGGLMLPLTIHEFLVGCRGEAPKDLKADYNPPPEETIQRTLHDWLALADRNMFLAIGLELAFGLRAGEVPQITWAMLTEERGRPLLSGEVQAQKNKRSQIVVVPLDPFWRCLINRIRREGWQGKPQEPIITGTPHEVAKLFRAISAWIVAHGWKTKKKSHALRAYGGALVAMKFDVGKASKWLRHADFKVTQSNYGHFLDHRQFRPEEIRARWGRKLLRGAL